MYPVQVLQHRTRVPLRFILRVLPAHRTPFQIIRLVNILMRREKVVHNDEMDLASSRQLNTMQAIEPAEERVRILLDVIKVLRKNAQQELVFRVSNRLDDEAVVARKVEEGA